MEVLDLTSRRSSGEGDREGEGERGARVLCGKRAVRSVRISAGRIVVEREGASVWRMWDVMDWWRNLECDVIRVSVCTLEIL